MKDIREAARWDCEDYTHSRIPTRTSTRSLHGGMNKEAFVGGNEEERAGKEEQRAALRNPKLIWRLSEIQVESPKIGENQLTRANQLAGSGQCRHQFFCLSRSV